MGKILDVLIGDKNRLDKRPYAEIDNRDTNIDISVDLGVATVSSKSDMLEVADAIESGYILVVNLEDLDSTLTKDEISSYLLDTSEKVGSHMAWSSESRDELIIAPPSVKIRKNTINS